MKAIRRLKRSVAPPAPPSPHRSGTHAIGARAHEREEAFDAEKVARLKAALERGELVIDVELVAARIIDE